MAFLISVIKRIFCVDGDDRSSTLHNPVLHPSLNTPLTRQSNSSTGGYDPSLYRTAPDRDPQLFSKLNPPQASQSSSGVTNSSFRSRSDSYPSRETHTSKQPSNSSRENFAESRALPSLSRNVTVDSSKPEPPKPPPISTNAPLTRQSNSSTGVYDPSLYRTARDRDPQLFSKLNPPQASQSSSGVTNSSFRSRSDSYPSRETHTSKQPSNSSRENFAESRALPNLSRNVTVDSSKPEPPKPPPISTKPTITVASSSFSSPQSKNAYIWVEKDVSSTYVFPKEIKSFIEKDIVPGVLKMPLSKSSYKDYFHALLYAEDCYLEKWDGFEMKNVKVKLHEATIYTSRGNNRNLKYEDNDDKFFVEFELVKIRERRPFLISRDFVSLQPTKQTIKPFQGVIYRVVNSNHVLAEFGQEFFSRHHPDDEYDVKFSFNRVCLKRAHQAIAAASESQLNNLLFPSIPPKHELPSSQRYIHQKKPLAVGQILRLEGLPPYLVEGPLALERDKLSYLVEGPLAVERDKLSKTGEVVVEAIIQIIRADPSKKILLCAPMNRTCDVLMRGLKKEIAESEMFRANAAFREVDGVPEDILSSCLYEDDKEYFSCPEFGKLKKYKVISSTFISSYRLYGEGIKAGYFSHIFVVDASSATEPEAMVTLANFVTAKTVVVVTGAPRNRSGWIRSEIARQNGLRTSYFERLRNSAMYKELDSKFIVHLDDGEKQTYQTRSSRLLF